MDNTELFCFIGQSGDPEVWKSYTNFSIHYPYFKTKYKKSSGTLI